MIYIILLLYISLLYLLYHLSQKHIPYSKRILLGLTLGILLGAIIQALFGAESQGTQFLMDWISMPGSIYVRLLQMLVVPLIFVSLVTAFTQMQNQTNIGKISVHVLSILMVTVMIAAVVGIGSVLLFHLDGAQFTQGSQEIARLATIEETKTSLEGLTLPQQIVSFFPSNIFEDFAGSRSTSTIAVVIFSLLTGTAYLGVARKHPEDAKTFKQLIDAFHRIVMRMVTLILRLAPYGILALMTKMVATSSLSALINMGTVLIASYTSFAVMFLIHGLFLIFHGLSPLTYFKKVASVLSFAFTSRSSAAAVPLNIQTQQEALGVDTTIANFSASFGMSIGQNGCAGIYPAMLVTMIAPSVGLDLSNPMVWLSIVTTIAVSSFGVAGVGGGATFASLIVFGTLGLPVEIIGLMISIEPVIDMGRTALNVNDSILAGVISAKQLNRLDKTIFDDPNQGLVSQP